MRLRNIEALALPATERANVTGKRPELKWVRPRDLLVDETYQRELSTTSIKLIGRIVAGFSWAKMKPPVATRVDGGYHVIDGQHTAIAAASIPIDEIPVFVVDTKELVERADAFVAHNRNRLNISQLQIHKALYAAGEETAVEMQRMLDKVGVRLRVVSRSSSINVGDTAAVSSIRRMVSVHGLMRSRQALEACVKGKRAPLGEAEMIAALDIVRGSKGDVVEELARAIRIEGDEGIMRAKSQAQMAKTSTWRCLAEVYRKRMAGKK
jgi:hypothetical protein